MSDAHRDGIASERARQNIRARRRYLPSRVAEVTFHMQRTFGLVLCRVYVHFFRGVQAELCRGHHRRVEWCRLRTSKIRRRSVAQHDALVVADGGVRKGRPAAGSHPTTCIHRHTGGPGETAKGETQSCTATSAPRTKEQRPEHAQHRTRFPTSPSQLSHPPPAAPSSLIVWPCSPVWRGPPHRKGALGGAHLVSRPWAPTTKQPRTKQPVSRVRRLIELDARSRSLDLARSLQSLVFVDFAFEAVRSVRLF